MENDWKVYSLQSTQGNQTKSAWSKRKLDDLKGINNSKAIRTMMATKHHRGWLCSDKGVKTRNKVRCIQALSSTVQTMINKTEATQT